MYNTSKFEIIKNQLSNLQSEISSLTAEEIQVPELIEKTNLLRQNELLKKLIEKKSLLVNVYLSYNEILEELLSKPYQNKSRISHKPKKKKVQKRRSVAKKTKIKKTKSKKILKSKQKTRKKRKIRK